MLERASSVLTPPELWKALIEALLKYEERRHASTGSAVAAEPNAMLSLSEPDPA
jgi:hypothetical protein